MMGVFEASRSFTYSDSVYNELCESYGPLPAELAHAVLKRRIEFLMGRICARTLLQRHFNINADVAIKPDRWPHWPDGIAGSITHCNSFVRVVVARLSDCISVGIDSERWMTEATAASVASTIASPQELRLPSALTFPASVTLLFSLKESLYKGLYPLAKTYMNFSDVSVNTLDWRAQRAQLSLAVDVGMFRRGQLFEVSFSWDGEMIHTSMFLEVISFLS